MNSKTFRNNAYELSLSKSNTFRSTSDLRKRSKSKCIAGKSMTRAARKVDTAIQTDPISYKEEITQTEEVKRLSSSSLHDEEFVQFIKAVSLHPQESIEPEPTKVAKYKRLQYNINHLKKTFNKYKAIFENKHINENTYYTFECPKEQSIIGDNRNVFNENDPTENSEEGLDEDRTRSVSFINGLYNALFVR